MYIIAMSVKIYKGVKNRRMFMALDGQLSVLYFCTLVFRYKGGYEVYEYQERQITLMNGMLEKLNVAYKQWLEEE